MAKIVLMRHGESLWNKKGLWTGWQDSDLSFKGKKEAKDAAVKLKNMDFHLFFTSDLKRAYKTMEIIKKELKLDHLPTVKHTALKERHYGEYSGKNKWQIKKKVGLDMFKQIRRGWNTPIKKGETLKEVFERVVPYFQKAIMPHLKKNKNILLVAHGNSIRALVKHFEGISDENISEVEIRTGEAIIYETDKSGKIRIIS